MHLHDLLMKVYKEERDHVHLYAKEAPAEVIAERLGITLEKLNMVKQVRITCVRSTELSFSHFDCEVPSISNREIMRVGPQKMPISSLQSLGAEQVDRPRASASCSVS